MGQAETLGETIGSQKSVITMVKMITQTLERLRISSSEDEGNNQLRSAYSQIYKNNKLTSNDCIIVTSKLQFIQKAIIPGACQGHNSSNVVKFYSVVLVSRAQWAFWCCSRYCRTKTTFIKKNVVSRKSSNTLPNKINKKVGKVLMYNYDYSKAYYHFCNPLQIMVSNLNAIQIKISVQR